MAPRILGALCFVVTFRGTRGAAFLCRLAASADSPPAWESGNVVSVNESVLLFGVGVDELVGQGWGSRVLTLGAMYAQFVHRREDRVVGMPHDTRMTYSAFDLHPNVTTLPLEAFGNMLADTSEGSVIGFQIEGGRTKSGDQMMNMHSGQSFARTLVHQNLVGCWESFDAFIWQMFEQLIANHETPFADYIGVHVRHGDKVEEGGITDMETVMSIVQKTPHWKDLGHFFVATDDLNVLEQEVLQFHPPRDPLARASQDDEYAWNWTESRHRHPGGEPQTCTEGHCHHENTAGSIRAALADTLNLALAPVLVGSFNSNFFKLPWLLNYLRRTPQQRQEEWCWDVFSKQPCHDRFEFAYSFVRKHHLWDSGVGFRRDGTDLLKNCLDPTLEENQ